MGGYWGAIGWVCVLGLLGAKIGAEIGGRLLVGGDFRLAGIGSFRVIRLLGFELVFFFITVGTLVDIIIELFWWGTTKVK